MNVRAIPLNTGDPCRTCMGRGFFSEPNGYGGTTCSDCYDCMGTGDIASILPESQHARDVLSRVIGIYEGSE